MGVDGRGRLRTVEDGRDGGDPRGRPGTARVMSHDASKNRSEVYGFNSSQYRSEMMGLSIL